MGVQVNTPVRVDGWRPQERPESRLKVRRAGRSESVAVAVKVSSDSSSTVLLPIAARTGA